VLQYWNVYGTPYRFSLTGSNLFNTGKSPLRETLQNQEFVSIPNRDKKLDILLSSADFFPNSFGGGEVYVYHLAKELLRRSHNVTVFTPAKWNGQKDHYKVESYKFENIPVVTYSLNPEVVSPEERHTGFGPLTIQILRKILNERLPDIVHINGIKSALAAVCNELKIAHVVTAHHMGIACPAGGLLRSDNSICDKPANFRDCVPCCSSLRAPRWYTGWVLGHIPPRIYRPIGRALNNLKSLPYLGRGLIYPWLIEQSLVAEKILLEEAQLFIAPSMGIRELLIRNGCKAEKITVIPHGIEPLNKLPIEKIECRPIRFGYLGRIDPSKGLHVLLEALELLPSRNLCELHIFGATRNAWDEEYWKKTLNSYKKKAKVFSHGLIPHHRLIDVFSKIDILIVPSLLPEAFGLVVQEAFSAGRPVIVSKSGGPAELVRDGVDGFVVERNNGKALAEAMQKFINNPELIKKMSNQLKKVRTIQEYVNDIEKIYFRMVSTGKIS
jgi:glycosyltransferase involved in cell wall biosynthesis